MVFFLNTFFYYSKCFWYGKNMKILTLFVINKKFRDHEYGAQSYNIDAAEKALQLHNFRKILVNEDIKSKNQFVFDYRRQTK